MGCEMACYSECAWKVGENVDFDMLCLKFVLNCVYLEICEQKSVCKLCIFCYM